MIQSSHYARLGSRLQSLDLSEVARALHGSLSSPNSAKLLKAVESEDWVAATTIKCDPRDYLSAASYMQDAIPASLLKKAEDLPLEVDRQAATYEKWIAAEYDCFRTNQRLYRFRKGMVHHLPSDIAVHHHLDGVRKIVESWIGYGPPRSLELGFSPGSTLTDRGRKATIAHKISNSPSVTPQFDTAGYPLFVGTLWHHNMVDAGKTPVIVQGGEYFTVPKTSWVERAAELQPSLPCSVQLAYGRKLREKLRSNTGLSLNGTVAYQGFGWDMSKAQEVHREVARRASVDRSFCTIDLSSASDTIARECVRLLLPPLWYRHLDGIRTHKVLIPKGLGHDGYRVLEKFSSMGNGFTFELETILFAAVACYVSRRAGYWGELGFDVFVYGDDIIVRDELYGDVESILVFLGFTVNAEKSFKGNHPFRESCGGDFFNGVNVRPTNLGKVNDLEASEIITVVNKIKRCSERAEAACGSNLNRLWFHLLAYLPRGVRNVRGPEWLGDSVIYDPLPGSWTTRCDGFATDIKCILTVADEAWLPWHLFDEATQLAVAVLGFGDGRRGLLPRNPKLYLEFGWTTLSLVSAPTCVDPRIDKALSDFRKWK